MSIELQNHKINIRPLSPDADVAITSLSGEFREVFQNLPRLRSNLIIDAGGYIGTAAIVFAEAYPASTVVSLEPSSDNFEILKRNVSKYGNIWPIKKAISSTPDSLTLKNRGTGEWGYTVVQSPADNKSAHALEVVECTTVDEIMTDFGYSGVGIIKIDIEGAEFDLLQRNIEWINQTDAICIELHDRIHPGCTEKYELATAGRDNQVMRGEKCLSIAKGLFQN